MQIPLAEKLRPQDLTDYVGQAHLVGKNGPLSKMLLSGKVSSMILWGPPGCGKTTLARLVSKYIDARFISFSAVINGIAEVKKVIAEAQKEQGFFQKQTILFIDEIHRFNKAQQDAFLPFLEDGTIILIGATTENPSFYVNAPLLSRTRVFQFKELSSSDLHKIVKRVQIEYPQHTWQKSATDYLLKLSQGDARVVINTMELAAELSNKITLNLIEQVAQQKNVYYDKKGDNHYNVISAFIKSMRGGDADATLHYLARMIKAGEDPMFIARRMLIFASEDIGNARPTALVLATACIQAVKMIGMPESGLILAQTATYLATAEKSIASTTGLFEALADIDKGEFGEIPLHLLNAPTSLMKQLDYGKGHVRYPWLEQKKTGKKVKQSYLPKNLQNKKYYQPDWK